MVSVSPAPPTSVCEDGICTLFESADNCPQDCGGKVLDDESGDGLADTSSPGVMFYTKAIRDLKVKSLDIFLDGEGSSRVQIFQRNGKYTGRELNTEGWELVGDFESVSWTPSGNKVTLSGFDPVFVPAGSEKSFLIWLENDSDEKIKCGLGGTEGEELDISDDSLKIYRGVGVAEKLAGSGSDITRPITFVGIIG